MVPKPPMAMTAAACQAAPAMSNGLSNDFHVSTVFDQAIREPVTTYRLPTRSSRNSKMPHISMLTDESYGGHVTT